MKQKTEVSTNTWPGFYWYKSNFAAVKISNLTELEDLSIFWLDKGNIV